jgi:hypothetical protein
MLMMSGKVKSPRLYPIRTSANAWNIRLYSTHSCSNECRLSAIEDDFGIVIVPNPLYIDGKCPYSSTLHRTILKISEFNGGNPLTIDGPLLSGESIVIPDVKIQIELSFPFLKGTKKFYVESPVTLGFSLIEIITTLSNIYKKIYEEEERTSSENTYSIERPCDCIFIPNIDKIPGSRTEINNDPSTPKDCPICLESPREHSAEKSMARTPCHHTFHTPCLDTWLSNNKNCPLCRENLMKCEVCEGSEKISLEYTGKVIPRDMRSLYQGRNETNGRYGIHSFDYEDLYLESFFYNNISKILYPKIIC